MHLTIWIAVDNIVCRGIFFVFWQYCNEFGVSDQSHNTTRMTFNRVYLAPRALESASWELALMPILYNIIQQLHTAFTYVENASCELALMPIFYNNNPIIHLQ